MECLPERLHLHQGQQLSLGEKGLLNTMVESLERQLIMEALEESQGSKALAAKKLGISRSGFYKKLRRYGLA